MVYVEVLSSCILASFALGSAIFILLGLLPTLLPNAQAALVRQREELRQAQAGTERDIAEIRKATEAITTISTQANALAGDIQGILGFAVFAAGLYIVSGILGL